MKPSLLILAAGIGSRYGGIKQLDAFGPGGETLMDYSIYDAKNAGFDKVTFVIRKAIEKDFKEILSRRLEDKIEIHYVFQELEDIPQGFQVPPDRVKPWGTGHAVLSAADAIQEPFLVLNADDFYGAESFKIAFNYLSSLQNDDRKYCIIGYELAKTLSKHGPVSRAICETDSYSNLVQIVECLKIWEQDGQIVYEDDGKIINVMGDPLVSMNMMGFTPSIFNQLRDRFEKFLKESGKNIKAEFLLPNVLNDVVRNKEAVVKVLPSRAKWFGVTYPEDRKNVITNIRKLIEEGRYPEKLWEN